MDIIPYISDKKLYKDLMILERIVEPDRVVSFRVAWEDDNRKIHVNRGYRVQQNNAIGPYKGGIRFSPNVNLSILKFLALEQTFKNSLTGLPLGGAKGGSDFDPKGKSPREVMRFCQAFMTELHRHIGPNMDVPAGDIGVGAREVGFMFGQYKRLVNRFEGVLTGKGLEFGGSHMRTEATGLGTVYMMEEMLSHHNENIDGRICVVSGSGNVSLYCARRLIELGGKVVAMSDSGGFIHDKQGLTHEKLDWLMEHKLERRGRIEAYATEFGADFYAGQRPWSIPCELAFPCAVQNELELIDAEMLIKNGLRAIAEGANMPTTPQAIKLIQETRKVLHAPSKAANAGGVSVSGLEMSQNSLRLQWTAENVNERLRQVIRNIHDQCVEYGVCEDGHVDYFKGANLAGFNKVAKAMVAYGVM